ncbi:glycosyltransferase family 4 protein [Clostridium felsineum]|uniref:glycosyltransferase family 4 protein n=1 Tax=Clostridium felsineum TaxID=36839 RepID=UPI00214DBFD1|nr:glycosyltransferase family 1 protein [Clostridium felsineum]MCR3757949.1 glycosyltransferase family 4 protein [Clostridium felsineum]
MKQVIFNALQTSLNGGIGRYSYELSKAIYMKKKFDFKIVIREQDASLFDFACDQDLIRVSKIENSLKRNYYEQFILPKIINKKYSNSIVHYPDTMAPIFLENKVITTVHDLAFKTLKKSFTLKTELWKNFITDLSVKKSEKIIAITNFAKEEIMKYYKINSNKIHVIYNGFNEFSQKPIEYNKISSQLMELENKKYILTVSTISPRKNIDGLIKAFNIIKSKRECMLVIAGRNGWMYKNVYKLVDKYKLKDRIIFTGKVNDNELKFLYKNARVFVYPSFYEGFGLPPLEAMSYSVPCAVSDRSSIPEVVGDAALTFNPNNINEIAVSINELLEKDDLRNDLLHKSLYRIEKFSWNKCAEGVIKVYSSI